MTDADIILWCIEFDLTQDDEWIEAYWQWQEDTYDPDR